MGGPKRTRTRFANLAWIVGHDRGWERIYVLRNLCTHKSRWLWRVEKARGSLLGGSSNLSLKYESSNHPKRLHSQLMREDHKGRVQRFLRTVDHALAPTAQLPGSYGVRGYSVFYRGQIVGYGCLVSYHRDKSRVSHVGTIQIFSRKDFFLSAVEILFGTLHQYAAKLGLKKLHAQEIASNSLELGWWIGNKFCIEGILTGIIALPSSHAEDLILLGVQL